MKTRMSHAFAASTLVEMLVVIVVSGILFVALFDGVDLVRKYTSRLSKTLVSGNTLLDSFQQLDYLFYSSDSVCTGADSICFYRYGERQASIETRDSFLFSSRQGQYDTLFRAVTGVKIVPLKESLSLVDSLGVFFLYKGKPHYFSFGVSARPERTGEMEARELEDQYKKEDDELE